MGRGRGKSGNQVTQQLRSAGDRVSEHRKKLHEYSSPHLLGESWSIENYNYAYLKELIEDDSDFSHPEQVLNLGSEGVKTKIVYENSYDSDYSDYDEPEYSNIVEAEIKEIDWDKFVATNWGKLRINAYKQKKDLGEIYADSKENREAFESLPIEDQVETLAQFDQSMRMMTRKNEVLDARSLEDSLVQRLVGADEIDKEAFEKIFKSFEFETKDFYLEHRPDYDSDALYAIPCKDSDKWKKFNQTVEDYLSQTESASEKDLWIKDCIG